MTRHKSDPFLIKTSSGDLSDRKLESHHWTDQEGFVLNEHNFSAQLGPVIGGRKLKFGLLLLVALFLVLGVRIFYLQVMRGNYYRDLAEDNRIRLVRLESPRGIIYDNQGAPLVRNVPKFSLQFTPADLTTDTTEQAMIIGEIAKITGQNQEELMATLTDNETYSYLPLTLIDELTYDQAIAIKIASTNWSGWQVAERWRREYLAGESFSHVLGYVGQLTSEEYDSLKAEGYRLNDLVGKSGLEKFYETDLRGEFGEKSVEVDALGKESKILAQVDAVSGNSLYLYLDSALQNKLAEELAAALVARRLVKAAAVIIDPNSGGVLSLVSLPGFDNNLFSGTLSQEQFATLFLSEDQPLFNRAISGQYPSGSSIKPLIASAALEEGIIDRETTFNSTGGIYYDTWFFPDWKAGGHGQTNVVRALAESVNTFFYLIGIEEYDGRVGLGLDGMLKYLHKYNFGAPLGIDLPGEASGFLPDRYWKWETKNEPWYPGDTMHLAIGQGDILVTPLQMANYVAAVANGGTLYQPRLVWEKELKSTDVRLVEPTKILDNQVVSQESLAVVREGMRAAVTWGSARLLNSATYQAAGKTGTAQVGGDQNTHSWFVGFAPYDNPQIAWAIIIENGGEGSDLAVPIMKKVLDWYFSR